MVPRGGVCATWVCAWRQRQRPGDPARQRTTQCVCVRGCVCVCVCGGPCVCVWGGMHVVCGQRHRHRITQPGKGQHCVCARACVYVCVHTRMCVAWAGCLCVGGGGAGGGVCRVCDMPRWCCVVGVCSPGVRLWVREGGRGKRERPRDTGRQRTTQCVCVCGGGGCVVWGAGRDVSVCVGMHMWCVGRDRGRETQPGKGHEAWLGKF